MLDYLKSIHLQKTTQLGLFQIACGILSVVFFKDISLGKDLMYAGIGAIAWPENVQKPESKFIVKQ